MMFLISLAFLVAAATGWFCVTGISSVRNFKKLTSRL